MKSFTITAVLVAFTSAASSDFPSFDSMHAHCETKAVYAGTTCSALWT